MKKWGKILTGLVSLCLAWSVAGTDCRAAQNPVTPEPYTYTVTIHLGNPDNGGSFTGGPAIDGSSSANTTVNSDTVVIKGLKAGERVNLTAQDFVSVPDGGKYYAKAIRQSGRDSAEGSYAVKGDMDFVVAYGIRGDMVAYTVNYQDAAGNALAQSSTYYGNVGDKPVVSYRYIEGYEPQAYNLTGTLTENAADNVFTFVYTPIEEGNEGGGEGDGNQPSVAPGQSQGQGAAPQAPAEAPANPAAPAPATPAPGTPAPAAPAPAGPAAPDDGPAAPAVPDGGPAAPDAPDTPVVDIPDDDVPQDDGPEELVDLDDENVPLADTIPDDEVPLAQGKRLGAVAIAAGVVGAAALIGVLIWLWMQKKKKKEEEA